MSFVFFTSTVGWLTLFSRFLILAIWSHHIRMTAKILQSGNIFYIGLVNNTLCYFGKLSSSVKYNLFHAYWTSYYECELWSLSNSNVNEFCVAWRKSLRRVWGIPFQTHGVLLPLLSQCLSVLNEICQRSLNFGRSCIRHESTFVQFIALHGLHARSSSLFGCNEVYCAERFNSFINDLINMYVYSPHTAERQRLGLPSSANTHLTSDVAKNNKKVLSSVHCTS